MKEIPAQLNNLRQSPRKVRLVADLVRGKKVADAVLTLQFANKRASFPIFKLINSALANAKARSIETDNLVVKKIEVNSDKTLMRRRPAPHGSAHPIRKRVSRVFIELAENKVKSQNASQVAEQSSLRGKKIKNESKPEVKKKVEPKSKKVAEKS